MNLAYSLVIICVVFAVSIAAIYANTFDQVKTVTQLCEELADERAGLCEAREGEIREDPPCDTSGGKATCVKPISPIPVIVPPRGDMCSQTWIHHYNSCIERFNLLP